MLLDAILDRYPELEPGAILERLPDPLVLDILEEIEAELDAERFSKFESLFPDIADCPLIDERGFHYQRIGSFKAYARQHYAKHMEFFEAGAKYRARCLMAANRVGKALKNGTPVATPSGWRPIETLAVGDEVIAGDGSITLVAGVYPQGLKPLYRLTFDSGAIECCGEHLWKWQHPRARFPYRQSHGKRETNPFHGEWSVSNTASIIASIGLAPPSRRRAVVPSSPPWQLPTSAVPLDPWLIGVLLGDGCTIYTASFSSADAEIVEGVKAVIPEGVTVKHRSKYDYSIAAPPGRRNPVIAALRELDIMGRCSAQKRVPSAYLLGDAAQRLAILQGLMDTDGHITRTGAMEFGTVSPDLAADVQFLVQSLGGKARMVRATVGFRVKVRLNLCPFRLSRKADRWAPRHRRDDHVLHRIEPAGEAEATCIAVTHPEHTFVTQHGIVTHNTFSGGGYELACHLTGRYPKWWPGRRFRQPIRAWACGKTNETTRDIVQTVLLGDVAYAGSRKHVDGSGVIPRECLGTDAGQITWKQGVQDLIDTIKIKHVTGGWSKLGLKSYQQGRGSFEGTSQHVIWDDEEPPMDIYSEQVVRTATTNGILMLTFTPLQGMSDVVRQFLDR